MGEEIRWNPHTDAHNLLGLLVPGCSPVVYDNIGAEEICTASEVAMLGREDLRVLGLTMLERMCILRWAEEFNKRAECMDIGLLTESTLVLANSSVDSLGLEDRLRKVGNDEEFWTGIAQSDLSYSRPDHAGAVVVEVSDFTPERLKEIYQKVSHQSGGVFSVRQLDIALQNCDERHKHNDDQLRKILKRVAGDTNHMQFREFECAASMLKLGGLFCHGNDFELGESEQPTFSTQVTVIDSSITPIAHCVYKDQKGFAAFIFSHQVPNRELHKTNLMKWVHVHVGNSRDPYWLTVLRALAVKYRIQPLIVEDITDQRQSKLERFGRHFFVAFNHICLLTRTTHFTSGALSPVQLCGRHVALFCAGEVGTLISISQADTSFFNEWPGGTGACALEGHDPWMEKLKARLLSTKGSHLREYGTEFLLYQILDLCADDLADLIKEYSSWLDCLRGLAASSVNIGQNNLWVKQVSCAQLQLDVVIQRIKNFRRVLAAIESDNGFDELECYWRAVADNLQGAQEDGLHIKQWCSGLLNSFKQIQRRKKEVRTAHVETWMNKTLFILTVASAVFLPAQFLSGVYGMNFHVPQNKKPSIPELVMPQGYSLFWIITVIYFVISSFCACGAYRRFKGTLNATLPAAWERHSDCNFDYMIPLSPMVDMNIRRRSM